MSGRTNPNIWLIMPVFLLGLAADAALSFNGVENAVGHTFYVSMNGSNQNPGTESEPFRTIQMAAHIMQPGDTCYIRSGTYRETVRPARSGTAEAPIRFVAYPGERPVVSGADILDVSWTIHSGEIYQATTNKEFIQLFVDGQMMNEARWPNTTVDGLVHMTRATCDQGTNANTLVDNALPAGDWQGAYVHITPGSQWNSLTTQIENYNSGNQFNFVFISSRHWVNDSLKPKSGNPYWLFGALAGLDIPTECFLDSSADKVYLWCPGKPDPNVHTIEVKQRVYAFDLSGLSHIYVKGLRILAAGINMRDSAHCIVDNCHLKYPEHTRFVWSWSGGAVKANYLGGHHNEWKNSSIIYSATNGIYDAGRYNKVTNCIIHDVDYMAGQHAAITSVGYGGEYTFNTLYNSGRNCIRHQNASGFRIEHNNMFNAGLLTHDLGVTTTYGTDGQGAIIAYNYIHDNWTVVGNGIYLDNLCPNYNVHHNFVWNCSHSGIRLNTPSKSNEIYNNTILDSCKYAFNYWNNPSITPKPTMVGTKVINNLTKAPLVVVTGANGPERHHNGDYAVDANGWPTPSSGAIDAGVVIPGITNGYVGSAPDIGCYEIGTEGWQAGADWVDTFVWEETYFEGFEGYFKKFSWKHHGDAEWSVTSSTRHSGTRSAKAGAIDHDESTTLQVRLDCVSGNIFFYRQVSSESGCDYLKFYIDGLEKGKWSGEQDWAKASFPVAAGTRTFKWTYSKNGSASEGDDTAWIDDIVFPVVSRNGPADTPAQK